MEFNHQTSRCAPAPIIAGADGAAETKPTSPGDPKAPPPEGKSAPTGTAEAENKPGAENKK